VAERRADPYHDLDVIDTRAPRFNQAAIGTLALVAVVTGWWPLLGLLALQFALGRGHAAGSGAPDMRETTTAAASARRAASASSARRPDEVRR